MNRIDNKFAQLKKSGKKALIIFITAGDPDLSTTQKLVPKLFEAGADIVELGIPFSDPLADGPTIQASHMRALKSGTSPRKILRMVKDIRQKCDEPIVFMTAYNLIYSYGDAAFARDAGKCGVDGVIFPDLTPDESGGILPHLKRNGICPIFLAAPTGGAERIKKITKKSRGFVYYISVAGITGKQKPTVDEVKRHVDKIKKATSLPVACGFGISTPKEAAEISRVTDGVIMGSALVKIIGGRGSKAARIKELCGFVKKVRRSMDSKRAKEG